MPDGKCRKIYLSTKPSTLLTSKDMVLKAERYLSQRTLGLLLAIKLGSVISEYALPQFGIDAVCKMACSWMMMFPTLVPAFIERLEQVKRFGYCEKQ